MSIIKIIILIVPHNRIVILFLSHNINLIKSIFCRNNFVITDLQLKIASKVATWIVRNIPLNRSIQLHLASVVVKANI